MRKMIIEFLIWLLLPGYHVAKNPIHNKKKEEGK